MNQHAEGPICRGGEGNFFQQALIQIMIISQDSLSIDAGSIVFFAHLFPVCGNEIGILMLLQVLGENYSFSIPVGLRLKDLFSNGALILTNCT